MSGNTSETRCKHCQRRIAFSGNYWLQVETNGYLSGGFCLSNPNGRHEPTPPEGEAVPEQSKCEDACDAKNGIHTAMCHLRRNPAAPVVSTAAPEPECPICGKVECMTGLPDTTPAPESYKPAEGPKWNEILLKFREYRLWMHEQVNWLANKWQQRGDVECREEMLDLLRIEPDAAMPVTVDAPTSDIARQIAICEENGTKWAHFKVAEIKQLLATPKRIGDAEAVARKIANATVGALIHAANKEKKITLNYLDEMTIEITAILRPLLAPAPPCSECATLQVSENIIVRCHCCGGTQLWQRNKDGEIEVFHDCASGLHAMKERAEKAELECATLRKERDDAKLAAKYECVQKAIAIEQSLADSDRAEAAEAQLSTLRDALEAIKIALKEPAGGEYWTARKFLDDRGIYNGDLDDLRVLNKVAEAALAPTPEVAKE